jgi:hypothetical protein
MISLNYQYTKSKKIEVFKKCKDSLERNSQTVRKFDESIANVLYIATHLIVKTNRTPPSPTNRAIEIPQ